MSYFSKLLLSGILLGTTIQASAHADECCFPSLPFYGEVTLAYDNFRGMPDGSWNGNAGGLVAADFALSIGECYGLQFGGSYGIYDWDGRGTIAGGQTCSQQQQGFVTVALYRQVPCCEGLQGALAVDWMFNRHLGVFGLDPNFGQFRFQLGYLFDGRHEIGVWGTADLNKVHKDAYEISVGFRAVSQVNLFWRYYFCNGAESMIWAGAPYKDSLMFHKNQGEYILGANFRVPLSSNLYLDAHGVYMGGSGNSVSRHFQNYSADAYLGITYSFGAGSGECWSQCRPYMPIANNSNFLIDTSLNN